MSLETVLQIGKALRNSPDTLSNFRFAKSYADISDRNVLALSIPVGKDFSLQLDEAKAVPENEEKKLFYLTFKT